MIRVVTDLHHSVLYESLAILFLDRAILGPVELVVWKDGHYQTRTGPATEEFGRVPIVVDALDRADYVIATVGGTRPLFLSLAERLGATYIDHVGNAWDAPLRDNVLWAVKNDGRRGVTYHPEFHRVPYTEPTGDRIGAFHASLAHMPDCYREFERAGGVLYGTAENLVRPIDVAQARMGCLALWHCKDADGYGFGVHEAFASGRAVIGHASHYVGKLAEPLFVRGVTYLEPGDPASREQLVAIGRDARAHFDSLVDFDAEAERVRDYLVSIRENREP